MNKLALSLCLGSALLAITAAGSAETITFSGLPTTGFPPLTSPYTEGGFTVTNTAGQYYAGDAFGDPTPDLFEYEGASTITVVASGGGDFTFLDMDLANYSASGTYTFTGSLDGSTVFSLTGDIAGADTFSAYASPNALAPIDELTVTLDNAQGESDLDNITVNAIASTPEPSSFLLLGSGLLGVAGMLRRRFA